MLDSIGFLILGNVVIYILLFAILFACSVWSLLDHERDEPFRRSAICLYCTLLLVICLASTTRRFSVINTTFDKPMLSLDSSGATVYIYKKVKGDIKDLDGSYFTQIQTHSFRIDCSSKGRRLSHRECWNRLKNKSESELLALNDQSLEIKTAETNSN